jgi:hypothetical protein
MHFGVALRNIDGRIKKWKGNKFEIIPNRASYSFAGATAEFPLQDGG